MKREIKFRGRTTLGKWVKGFLVADNVIRDLSVGRVHFCDGVTIGQYTGLNDKNGIPIYEGDILRCWERKDDFSEKEYPNLLSVHFNALWGGFFAQDFYRKEFFSIWRKFCKYEVVGNIYENLDLLKK